MLTHKPNEVKPNQIKLHKLVPNYCNLQWHISGPQKTGPKHTPTWLSTVTRPDRMMLFNCLQPPCFLAISLSQWFQSPVCNWTGQFRIVPYGMMNMVQFSFVNIRSTLVFTGFPLSVSAMLALGSVMGGVMIADSPLATVGWFPIGRQRVAKLKWNFWTSNLIWVCLHVSKLPTQSHLEMIDCSRKSADFLAHSHLEFPTLSKENIREGEMTTLKHSSKKS